MQCSLSLVYLLCSRRLSTQFIIMLTMSYLQVFDKMHTSLLSKAIRFFDDIQGRLPSVSTYIHRNSPVAFLVSRVYSILFISASKSRTLLELRLENRRREDSLNTTCLPLPPRSTYWLHCRTKYNFSKAGPISVIRVWQHGSYGNNPMK